jgi:hypothetical protein
MVQRRYYPSTFLEGLGKTSQDVFQFELSLHSVDIERIMNWYPQKNGDGKLVWLESWNNSLDVGFEVLNSCDYEDYGIMGCNAV